MVATCCFVCLPSQRPLLRSRELSLVPARSSQLRGNLRQFDQQAVGIATVNRLRQRQWQHQNIDTQQTWHGLSRSKLCLDDALWDRLETEVRWTSLGLGPRRSYSRAHDSWHKSMSSGARLSVDWHDSVALLTINYPERRNAVNMATLAAIREAQIEVVDKGGRALVITGAAPAFCAGADLSGVHEEEFGAELHNVLHGFTALPIVTMACIDGPALGAGAQIVVSCDIRIATANSIIGVPAAKLGLVINHWTIGRIVHEFSWPVARAMLLTARTYTGAELAKMGSVHRLGNLSDALSWAKEIAALAPLSIAGHKLGLEVLASASQMNELLTEARERASASNDAKEGRAAFLEKRPPQFTGS